MMVLQFFGGRGSESGAGKKIPIANSISEANKIAVKYGFAKMAEFKGFSLKNANMIIQRMADTKRMFPNMLSLDFVGNPKYGNDITAKTARKNRNALAWVTIMITPDGVTPTQKVALNFKQEYFSDRRKAKINEILTLGVNKKFHPEGTTSLRAQVDHELGHILDRSIKGSRISSDSRITALFNKHKGAMKDVLSDYAKTNEQEFLAEAWSEYRNNPNPRPVAKEVGKIIKSYFKKT